LGKYEFVIIAEDDIIVSNDVIDYFNYMIPIYEKSDHITSISANLILETNLKENGVLERREFSGLVWGTWKKWWDLKLKEAWLPDLNTNQWNSWDLNISRIHFRYDLKCIAPVVSRSQHIGIHGQWCNEEIYKRTYANLFKPINKLINPVEYKEVMKNGQYTDMYIENRFI